MGHLGRKEQVPKEWSEMRASSTSNTARSTVITGNACAGRQPTFEHDTMSTSIRTNNIKGRNISAQGPRSHTVHVPELAFSHHPRVRFQIPLPVGVLEMQEERQPVLGNRVGVVVGVERGLV